MTNIEAIKNLTDAQLENFLDQVFLTGLNTGYHSLVDPDLYDKNPFDESWLNADVEEHPSLVENASGERLIIKPLAKVITHIIEFDRESISEDLHWQMQIVLPTDPESEDDDDA